MTSKVSIGIDAQLDTGSVLQQINDLGGKIAQANKVQYSPVSGKSADDLARMAKQFEQLRRIQGDLNKRMKATGQSGAGLLDLDWEKLYPDQHSRARQMKKAFEYSVGNQFSPAPAVAPHPLPPGGQPPGRPPGAPTPSPEPPAPAGPGMGTQVIGAGLRAAGPAGGVAANALGTGMSAGFGAGLMGLMGGMLALGVGKLVGGVMEKLDQAENNNVAMDNLKRTLGDVNVSFAALKMGVNASANNLKITYDEAGRLTQQFVKLGNVSAEQAATLGGEVGVGTGLSRAYGLDPSQGVGVMGQMRGIGATSNTQDSRRFALLIGETIGKSRAFAKSDEVMQALADFTVSQTRSSMSEANTKDYAGMYSSMVGSGIPGMDPTGASSMIGRVNASLTAGGAKGEASQFFTAMVGQRMGLDSLQTQVMREGGAFATNDGMFGKDSAYKRYMGKEGPAGGATFLEQTRAQIEEQYGGDSDDQKLLKAQAFGNHTGLAMNQSMAMLSLKPNQMGGMEKYGALKDFNAAGIGNLSKVLYGSEKDRRGVADGLLGRKDVSEDEKKEIRKVMAGTDVEKQKETLAGIVASKDQEDSLGKTAREQKALLDNIKTSLADQLVPAVNAMRAGIILMAGNSKMSEREILKKYAELESGDAQENIKSDRAQQVKEAWTEQADAAFKYQAAQVDYKNKQAAMSPEERKAAKANVDRLGEEKSLKDEAVRLRIIALREDTERLLKADRDKLAERLKGIDKSFIPPVEPYVGTSEAGGGRGSVNPAMAVGDGAMPPPALGNAPGQARGKGSTGGALEFFVGKGWSREQAAGIVANLHAESGMRPDAVGDSGKAYGMAQWHPDRQADFAEYAGKNIRGSSTEEQLGFVQHELTKGRERPAGDALRRTTTAAAAGEVVSRQYERPDKKDAEAVKRAALAESINRNQAPAESAPYAQAAARAKAAPAVKAPTEAKGERAPVAGFQALPSLAGAPAVKPLPAGSAAPRAPVPAAPALLPPQAQPRSTPLPEALRANPADARREDAAGQRAGAGGALSGEMSISLALSDEARRLFQPPSAPLNGRIGRAAPYGTSMT